MTSRRTRPQLLVAFAMFISITATAQPATQTKNESISGRVVNEAGQPISGVSISLEAMGGRLGQRTGTDPEGNFKIEGLDGGIYRFYLSAPGYVTQVPNSSAPTYRPGDKVELMMIKGAVIAGNVTNMNGEPLVNVQVRAFQIRDQDVNRVESPYGSQPVFTDDRGYYRMWSLRPGTYVVGAGGPGQYFGSVNVFANDAMTYAPASTRDTAAEITARGNQEVNVDIRYRGERGHSVSGKLSGMTPAPPYGASVRLVDVDSRVSVSFVTVNSADRTFQLDGVADGEYEIIAGGGSPDGLSSAPRRISVHGADVTGLDLTLATMASIDAHLNLEADQKLNCGRRRDSALRETMVTLKKSQEDKSAKDKPAEQPVASISAATAYDNVANDKGDIRFRNLSAATYRFDIRLPAAGWYLRDLSLAKPGINIARNGISLKLGDKVSGVVIAIAEGGASLRGRITLAEGETPPANLRIYLVPAERENSDNPLRFFEDVVAADQTFVIGNIAPGKYWLVAQAAEKDDASRSKSPRTDNDFRAQLLKTATTRNQEISFKPCERTVDYEFRYPATKP